MGSETNIEQLFTAFLLAVAKQFDFAVSGFSVLHLGLFYKNAKGNHAVFGRGGSMWTLGVYFAAFSKLGFELFPDLDHWLHAPCQRAVDRTKSLNLESLLIAPARLA